MKFKDHFSGHAADYANFRPGYTEALYRWLAQLVPAAQLIWECGCGNGQAARRLAEYFPRVIATDA
ncbi:MAG: class I SAM-dependent methyltransferase, partial [Gammaproteobacteria bacterium]|nr:class I SAM-dependent methyltransferase [Gammaproteobacteria bacterium]